MVGQKKSPVVESTQLRKVRKPIVEKRRRDRINNSLSQLKTLLAQSSKQHGSAISRLDKADILEMTVRYLTQLQQEQDQQPKSRETAGYSRGFKDCTRETIRYLRVSEALGNDRLCSLNSHLCGVYMAQTVSVNNIHSQSTAAVQKIINGNVKVAKSPRSRESSNYHLVMKIEQLDPVGAKEFNRNELSASVGPIINEEPIWRPW